MSESQAPPQAALAQHPIGIFDSGLGGLRVLDRLMHTLPEEHFVYLGDTLHMPYGQKTQAEVVQYVEDCLHWLFTVHQVKMVVVACNTAASVAAHVFEREALQRHPAVPFVDPVTPICRWLQADARYAHVGLMATPATVASNRYPQLLAGLQANVRLSQLACGNLATVIEEGGGNTPACAQLLAGFTDTLRAQQVEAVILGCTHYPYVMDQIATLMPEADILDPAVFMALEAKRLLAETALASPHPTGRTVASVDYFVTAAPDQFYETSRRMPFQALAMKQPSVVSISQPHPANPSSV